MDELVKPEESSAWLDWATKRRLAGKMPSNSMEAFINGFRWAKKDKYISPFVQGLIDVLRTSPERFDIEYCIKDAKYTHIQLRDIEADYSKGAWIYIKSGGYWYTDLSVAGEKLADNLARALTDDEIEAIYKVVKTRSTLLQFEEKETLLEKYLGKYVSK